MPTTWENVGAVQYPQQIEGIDAPGPHRSP
jgi:hypothetical protein